MKIALVQAEPVRFDKAANLERARRAVEEAAARGVRLVLFPEMFLTGYMVWDRVGDLAEPLDGPSIRALAEMARAHGTAIVCGFPEDAGRARPFNSACVIDVDGTILGAHRKVHLFAAEPDACSPGEEVRAFDTAVGRLGVMICYDLEFPETARLLALDGAQVILVPTANMDPYARHQAVYLAARAMENGVYLACANQVGRDEVYRYFGESAVVDPDGNVLARAGSGEELLVAEIDPASVPPADPNLRYLAHRRPELYAPLAAAPEPARRR